MDKNFEIMTAMNYGYDNPEARAKLNIDEKIVEIAGKSVLDYQTAEMISLYASMSVEKNAGRLALENLKNVRNMTNGIERVASK